MSNLESLQQHLQNLFEQQSLFRQKYAHTESGYVNVEVPSEYGPLPDLKETKYLHAYTLDEMKNHFNTFFDPEETEYIRLKFIDGIPIADEIGCNCMYCDYCHGEIKEVNYYRCYDCGIDMCGKCFEETCEEIVIKNRPLKWYSRKDSLEECRKHNLMLANISYIKNVVDRGDGRIMMVWCSYCKIDLNRKDDYHHCYDCDKNMCKLCFEETSEEIAINNFLDIWRSRKDKVKACRQHELSSVKLTRGIPIKDSEGMSFRNCDVCEKYFDVNVDKYLYFDGKTDYDMCETCADTEDGQNIIKEKKLEKTEFNLCVDVTDFGSMCDWIPLYVDDGNTIYMCLNKDSKHYRKIALSSTDDHGREGYFMVRKIEHDLAYILEKCREYSIKKNREESDEEGEEESEVEDDESDEYCSMPIKRVMEDFNMQTHYG